MVCTIERTVIEANVSKNERMGVCIERITLQETIYWRAAEHCAFRSITVCTIERTVIEANVRKNERMGVCIERIALQETVSNHLLASRGVLRCPLNKPRT